MKHKHQTILSLIGDCWLGFNWIGERGKRKEKDHDKERVSSVAVRKTKRKRRKTGRAQHTHMTVVLVMLAFFLLILVMFYLLFDQCFFFGYLLGCRLPFHWLLFHVDTHPYLRVHLRGHPFLSTLLLLALPLPMHMHMHRPPLWTHLELQMINLLRLKQ